MLQHLPRLTFTHVLCFVRSQWCIGNVVFGDGKPVAAVLKTLFVVTGDEKDPGVLTVTGGEQKINGLAWTHLGSDVGAPSTCKKEHILSVLFNKCTGILSMEILLPIKVKNIP